MLFPTTPALFQSFSLEPLCPSIFQGKVVLCVNLNTPCLGLSWDLALAEPIFIHPSESTNFPFCIALRADFYFSLSFKALRSPVPFCLSHGMTIKLFFPPALFNASFSRPPLTCSEKPLLSQVESGEERLRAAGTMELKSI